MANSITSTSDNLSQKSSATPQKSTASHQNAEDNTKVSLPTHLGFIVDGNRRWARARGLPTFEGHRRGLDKVEMVIEELAKHNEIKFASFYLFSTENWQRSPEEVGYLMDMVSNNLSRLLQKLKKNNIRTLILGSADCPRPDVWQELQRVVAATASCTGLTVCICFNYGGQQEIADAASQLLAKRVATQDPSPITPKDFQNYLYCPEVPPCDMIVRTSGEQRISGFQLWRAAYSEFLFLDQAFPNLTPTVIDDILAEYTHRQRRFGK